MTASLPRRAFAEFLGTGLLVTVVVGSGIAAQRLSHDAGLQLLENAVVTAAALPVLILICGPVSGAHLNPVVSLCDHLIGRSHREGISVRDLAVYIPVQIVGAVAGALLANAMFDTPQGYSTRTRAGGHLWLGEVVATAGLLLVIFGINRSGKTDKVPWAVGAYIGAAYWFTSSTSFANPAVSIGRAFSNTFAGIAPRSLPGFTIAQGLGAVVGLAVIYALYPNPERAASTITVPQDLPNSELAEERS